MRVHWLGAWDIGHRGTVRGAGDWGWGGRMGGRRVGRMNGRAETGRTARYRVRPWGRARAGAGEEPASMGCRGRGRMRRRGEGE